MQNLAPGTPGAPSGPIAVVGVGYPNGLLGTGAPGCFVAPGHREPRETEWSRPFPEGHEHGHGLATGEGHSSPPPQAPSTPHAADMGGARHPRPSSSGMAVPKISQRSGCHRDRKFWALPA
jgi:hypothetical protein